MPGARHGYEQDVDTPLALLAEYETIKIWKKFVMFEKQELRPAVSKNLFKDVYEK